MEMFKLHFLSLPLWLASAKTDGMVTDRRLRHITASPTYCTSTSPAKRLQGRLDLANSDSSSCAARNCEAMGIVFPVDGLMHQTTQDLDLPSAVQ